MKATPKQLSVKVKRMDLWYCLWRLSEYAYHKRKNYSGKMTQVSLSFLAENWKGGLRSSFPVPTS